MKTKTPFGPHSTSCLQLPKNTPDLSNIIAAYLNEKSRLTYILRTSFKHSEQTHGWIAISIDPDSTRVIGTAGNGQDQIFMQLAEAGNLLSATRMNLKWFHINHFDTGVCENLQLRTAF